MKKAAFEAPPNTAFFIFTRRQATGGRLRRLIRKSLAAMPSNKFDAKDLPSGVSCDADASEVSRVLAQPDGLPEPFLADSLAKLAVSDAPGISLEEDGDVKAASSVH